MDAAGTKIVVIGCGEWSLIKTYAGMYALRVVHSIKYLIRPTFRTTNLEENANFKGQLFADPTRTLYHALGMDIENLQRTPKGQARPSYISVGPIRDLVQSLWVNLSCLLSWHLTLFSNILYVTERTHKESKFHW